MRGAREILAEYSTIGIVSDEHRHIGETLRKSAGKSTCLRKGSSHAGAYRLRIDNAGTPIPMKADR